MAEAENYEEPVRLPQSGIDFYSNLKSRGSLAKFTSKSAKDQTFPPEIQQMINYCTPALKHGRPLNKVMIVLVGQTGSGKSTTINYLFNDNICAVSASSSETRRVTEYGKELCVTTESPPVIGLLSFVDPPGALDVDHSKEPLNLATIAKFCNEHEDLCPRKGVMSMSNKVREQVYPNLVLLNVKASDNRMDGPDSNLRKCLKALDKYGLLDKQHTNLMVVVTHAMQIPKKRYLEVTKETTRIIQDAIYKVLRLQDVQVIFVENVPEDYDMDKDLGCDFYKLPDGQLSHYNLIKAMELHFSNNNDVLGKLLCGWYFGDDCPEKKDKANVLQDIAHTQLTEEERKAAVQDMLSMDMQFCSQEEIVTPPYEFQFLGRGYCPKSETVIKGTVYTDTETTRQKLIGTFYSVPKSFTAVEINENHCYSLTAETEEIYQKSRITSYGLEEDTKMSLHVDSTGRWLEGNLPTADKIVAVIYEKRLLSVKIANIENHIKPQLKDAIMLLPNKYNPKSAHHFSEFFSKWGSHFVSKVWIGGSVKVDCIVEPSNTTKQMASDIYETVQVAFSKIENSSKDILDTEDKKLEMFNVCISGGNPPTLSALSELTPLRFSDWVQSIKKKPEELQFSLKLCPYYILTTGLRALSLSEATQQYLDGTIPDYVPIRTDMILSKSDYREISAELKTVRKPSQIRNDRKTQLERSQTEKGHAFSSLKNSGEFPVAAESNVTPSKSDEPLPTRNQVSSDMVKNAKLEANKGGSQCFPAWARVYTNQGWVHICHLQPGDRVWTLDCTSNPLTAHPTLTEFHTFLHYDSERMAEFLILHLENGRCITVTEDHLLFAQVEKDFKSIRVKNLKLGDKLICVKEDKLNHSKHVEISKIDKISRITAQGIYSPLTDQGTLLVEGVLASSYAHIDSHAIAHACMTPLLLWYRATYAVKNIINFGRMKISSDLTDSTTLRLRSCTKSHWHSGIHNYAEFLMAVVCKLPVPILANVDRFE